LRLPLRFPYPIVCPQQAISSTEFRLAENTAMQYTYMPLIPSERITMSSARVNFDGFIFLTVWCWARQDSSVDPTTSTVDGVNYNFKYLCRIYANCDPKNPVSADAHCRLPLVRQSQCNGVARARLLAQQSGILNHCSQNAITGVFNSDFFGSSPDGCFDLAYLPVPVFKSSSTAFARNI